ncbi:hypothetical protein [Rhizobium leguminosarum]|uniref:hypothetical protein n=1 Tax=Rhizobium leguminosarum TaxID=384 RepID=UPI0021B0CE51|nr:hypothetical protein [Rhizobium leguminosarum]
MSLNFARSDISFPQPQVVEKNATMHILPSWILESGSPRSQFCTLIEGAGEPLLKLEAMFYAPQYFMGRFVLEE